jgi:hypothetical protein
MVSGLLHCACRWRVAAAPVHPELSTAARLPPACMHAPPCVPAPAAFLPGACLHCLPPACTACMHLLHAAFLPRPAAACRCLPACTGLPACTCLTLKQRPCQLTSSCAFLQELLHLHALVCWPLLRPQPAAHVPQLHLFPFLETFERQISKVGIA